MSGTFLSAAICAGMEIVFCMAGYTAGCVQKTPVNAIGLDDEYTDENQRESEDKGNTYCPSCQIHDEICVERLYRRPADILSPGVYTMHSIKEVIYIWQYIQSLSPNIAVVPGVLVAFLNRSVPRSLVIYEQSHYKEDNRMFYMYMSPLGGIFLS